MTEIDIDQILDEARRLSLELRRNGDRLHVEGPRNVEWFIAKLVEAKPQILQALDTIDQIMTPAAAEQQILDALKPRLAQIADVPDFISGTELLRETSERVDVHIRDMMGRP